MSDIYHLCPNIAMFHLLRLTPFYNSKNTTYHRTYNDKMHKGTNASCNVHYLYNRVKVLHPIRHKIGHSRDVLLSQSVGMVLIELNPNKAESKKTQNQSDLS